ncbi:MAG: hypothetical protein CL573_03990 [Alphaproteobacteria bacterium]|nr:hypothetical protein [Alphaproteobacteria bacterium]HCP00235.1 hypothetical protein [Rhodospirillaceae bacterium]
MEWMIKCVSWPNMAERREATIARHIEHLDKFKAETWYSGPMISNDGSNANGSFRVVDFPTRDAAQNYIDTDPYTAAEIFERIDIEPLHPWTDIRQRAYDQTDGWSQFIVIARTEPQALEAGTSKVSGFLTDYSFQIVLAGALMDDTHFHLIGALYVIDVAERAFADVFLADEPLSRDPDGCNLTIERWRFGHV